MAFEFNSKKYDEKKRKQEEDYIREKLTFEEFLGRYMRLSSAADKVSEELQELKTKKVDMVFLNGKVMSIKDLADEMGMLETTNRSLKSEINHHIADKDELKGKISELESELKNRETQIKAYRKMLGIWDAEEAIRACGLFGEDDIEELEKELPFRDEQYEEDYIAELEERHQDDCIRINELTVSLNKIVDLYANLRKQMGVV